MASIQDAWQWAVNKCNEANIGYSQPYRNQQTVNGITYYDCSSFINYALLAGGFSTPQYAPEHNAFTTFTMGAELLRLGFKKVTDGSMKPGDIGVRNDSTMEHTEMIYQVAADGKSAQWMGAHSPNVPLADQVSITPAWVAQWFTDVYRYEDGAEPGPGPEPTPKPKPGPKLTPEMMYIPNVYRNPYRL